jgi:hypothetical protein
MPERKKKFSAKSICAGHRLSLRGSGADWFSRDCKSLAIMADFAVCDVACHQAVPEHSQNPSPALGISG